jgi:hypothetical protein
MQENKTLIHEIARRRFYGGVLLFTVAAGISLTAVPAIRARLLDRIHVLKIAIAGEEQPDIMPVGENDIPYPEEYMRPASSAVALRPFAESAPKRLTIVQPDVPIVTPPVLLGAKDSGKAAGAAVETEDDEDLLRFQQGEMEQEAYEKTLAANGKLAAMTQGGNPELNFKTWGASRRDGNIYWVRVIFQDTSGADMEYIWQTDISSGRSTPLNFNARNFQQ